MMLKKQRKGALAILLGSDSDSDNDNDKTNSNKTNNNNNSNTTINNNNKFLSTVHNVIDTTTLDTLVKKSKPINTLKYLRGDYDDDDDDTIIKTDSKIIPNVASSNTIIQKNSILQLMESSRAEVKASLSNKSNKSNSSNTSSYKSTSSYRSNSDDTDRKRKIDSDHSSTSKTRDIRPKLDIPPIGPLESINLTTNTTTTTNNNDDDDGTDVEHKSGKDNECDFYVNQYAAQYLLQHQREGVQWLADRYFEEQGCILGDDMGMGKTIQIACLLMAIYKKTGTYADKEANKRREKKDVDPITKEIAYHNAAPTLIVCNASLSRNWYNELEKWGYFSIAQTADKADTDAAIESIENGKKEILIVTYQKMVKEVNRLMDIEWSAIIYDEGHIMKNQKTQVYNAALSITNCSFRVVLSGTPLQNKINELWPLLNIIHNNKFMTLDTFIDRYEKPIKFANKKSATPFDISLSTERLNEFRVKVLSRVFLQRKKTILNSLKGKSDLIVMCDVMPVQARIYKEILQLPEYRTLLSEDKKRLPFLDSNPNEIDPRAVIWKKIHPDDEPCRNCSSCCTFPCIMKLLQVSSHPALLQVSNKDKKPDNDDAKGKRAFKVDAAQDKLDFLLNALTPKTLELLGGTQRNTLADGDRRDTSGKMQTLDKLLKHFKEYGLKVLVFSHSVMMLDIIEDFVKNAWNYIRLDGKTDTSQRQALCNQFNDPSKGVNLFLLSSRAGGLGLNLTAAYNVVIFDMDWNPSIDAQSQDRAYRIGQKEHVNVYRLVAKGTIEEIVYMRQLYKQEIAKSILDGDVGPKYFDEELHGLENLFQFSETSIFDKIRGKGTGEADGDDVDDDVDDSDDEIDKRKMKTGFKIVNTAKVSDDIENILINDDIDDDDDKDNLLSMLGIKKSQAHKHEDILHGKKRYKQQHITPAVESSVGTSKQQKLKSIDPIYPGAVVIDDDDDESGLNNTNEVVEEVVPMKSSGLYKPSYLH